MKKIYFTADDYGLTKGLSDTLYEKILRYDSLRNISAVPNGYHFKESIEKIKKIKNLRITCHLNIVECRPISEGRRINLLLDKNGHLNNSFSKILRVIIFSTKEKKRRYFRQIYKEIYAQIKYFNQVAQPAEIEINSHSHIHLFLPILRIITQISRKIKITSIRMPREVFLLNLDICESVRNFFSTNLIKFYLIRFMVSTGKKYLKEGGQKDFFLKKGYFIGVYYTKNMTTKVVTRCIEKIARSDNNYELIEILLHPGRLSSEDIARHILNPGTKKYYLTKKHSDEEDILKNSKYILNRQSLC